MTLRINVKESSTPTITLGGRLDTHTAPDLDRTLDRLLANKSITRMVFDLGNLEYLSSAGIRCFVRARKALEPRGGKVAIVNPQ
ncbi:MAG TPA: STAS domain-containing protein, partial [Steroidobacteraceae bacterium]|nr:STAS domain-containing protein [Steroidobacteraceae bacterium]